MESFLILIGLIIFFLPIILLFSIRSVMATRFDAVSRQLDELRQELLKLRSVTKPGATPVAEPVVEKKQEPVRPQPIVLPEPPKPTVSQPVSIPSPTPQPVAATPAVEKTEKVVITAPPVTPPKPPMPPPPPRPGFFERNPDLEKFIGENLANKIGIAILVLGIGFFVKYAIDQDWINEIGRVFIGILCGGLLLGIAHRMRKTFKAFSSVLVGGGLTVLYFTIAIAFHQYHIFSQIVAFLIMVVITAFAVLLSLAYDRLELAVLSAIGGFVTPFLVSTGDGNYVVLFTYMLTLNVGMLVLAYFKKWPLLRIIAFGFTVIIAGGWLGTKYDPANASMIAGALIFFSLFYLVFFMMIIINNIKERTPFQALEIGMLISNSFLFYSAGMVILQVPNAWNVDLQGLFTALLGVINFAFAFTLYRNQKVDRKLVYVLIGLVLTFISLAAPIQLDGNYITLFWAAESVLLLWLSQKSGIRIMKLASLIVSGLMVISLVMDWQQAYTYITEPYLPVVLNKIYITGVVSFLALSGLVWLAKKEKEVQADVLQTYQITMTLLATGVLYLTHLLELRYQLVLAADEPGATVVVGTYNIFFLLLILLGGQRITLPDVVKQNLAFISIFGMFTYWTYYLPYIIDSRDALLLGTTGTLGFVMHYVFITLLVILATLGVFKLRTLELPGKQALNWLFAFFYIFVASAELDTLVVYLGYSTERSIYYLLDHSHRIGYPILWGIASFVMIIMGFRQRNKSLRIIALVTFLVTLIKLFVFDIRDISEGGKIVAFIFLGVVLLIVSFMYQRLKKLLLDDSTHEQPVE